MFSLRTRFGPTMLGSLAVLTFCLEPCVAQTKTTAPSKSTWKEALKLIDSTSAADVAAAKSMLAQAIKSREPIPAAAKLAFVLCQLRQGDSSGALKSLGYIEKQTASEELDAIKGQRLRSRLFAALAVDDSAAADAAFKDLVRLALAGRADSVDLKAAAHAIGSTVAMLESDQAQSPIDKKTLEIAGSSLSTSKVRGVSYSYQFAYAQANERASAIVSNLALIQTSGLDAMRAIYARRAESLKQRQAELAQQKELNSEVARNSREQLDQNTVDLRQLNRDISRLANELRQPTPGHPGPKQPPPQAPPPRSAIRVDEYETRTDYEYVTQNGESVRVPVTRTERRPQSEIDRERDAIHRQMTDRYNLLMGEYRQYDLAYNNELRTWTANDQTRRQDLSTKKAEAESKRDDLVRANKEINEEKRDFAKELREKRTAEDQEAFELEMLQLAIDAAASGKPHTVFRPVNFEIINWSQEKTIAQKSVATFSP